MRNGQLKKRVWFISAVIAVVIILGALAILLMIRRTPAFYRPTALSTAERESAAQRATDEFVKVQNAASRARVAERREVASIDEIEIRLTEDELNSFFDKWSNFSDVRASYNRVVTEPVIVLEPGRVIFAARVRELNSVVSLHFEPKIAPDGRLDFALVRVLGGVLPLPRATLSRFESQLTQMIESNIATWRANARFDRDAAANNDLIAAAMGEFALNVLNHRTSEPVLFVPVVQGGTVAVRIMSVTVVKGILTMRVKPMSPADREAMLPRIRGVR